MDLLQRHIQQTTCRAQTAASAECVAQAVQRYHDTGNLHVLLLAAEPDPLLRAVATDANIAMGHKAELHMLTGSVLDEGAERVVVVGNTGRRELLGEAISSSSILQACGECHQV